MYTHAQSLPHSNYQITILFVRACVLSTRLRFATDDGKKNPKKTTTKNEAHFIPRAFPAEANKVSRNEEGITTEICLVNDIEHSVEQNLILAVCEARLH